MNFDQICFPFTYQAAKALKMSTDTETEKNSTDTESVKEVQEYHVIDKEKALQKLGEISVIDWEIKKQQKRDRRRERKKRSAIVGTLAEIVTTNKNKLVTQEDKIYFEDLDFLNLTLVSLQNRCQQCDTQGCDIIGICTECKHTFCDDCIRKHIKSFQIMNVCLEQIQHVDLYIMDR
ncbi:unnamed protein product [Mytilus edulis]|uniref:RING-type domain-containing protein n=1 Tax=Mytilus edulis TaxID=6550 RepID=A0A8S3SHJ9_MYTED|nr:unnamed protein product [Mytilus edulis]